MAASDGITAAVVLAGGQSRRMGGGEKFLLDLAGQSLIQHVLSRLRPQVGPVVIAANCNPTLLADCAVPVVADAPPSRGPLSGLLAGLRWATKHAPNCTHVLSVAADTPFIPRDLLARLRAGMKGSGSVAIATSAGRRHPVIGLWPASIREPLVDFLDRSASPSMMEFLGGLDWATVDFPLENGHDPFFNVNTPADLNEARRRVELP